MRETYKRLLCLITAIAVISGLFPAYAADVAGNGVSAPPVYSTDTLIEFEDGYIQNDAVQIRPSRTSSGGKCTTVQSGGRLDNPPSSHTPDISYKINIPSAGTYYIYMRYNAANDGSDSLYVRWNGGNYVYSGVKETKNEWGWTTLTGKGTSFTANAAGVYTLDFLHREPGLITDAFFVTKNPKAIDTEAVESEIGNSQSGSPEFALNSKAETFDLQDGFALFEAENTTFDTALFQKETEQMDASGGSYIAPSKAYQSGAPAQSAFGMEFNFNVDVSAPIYSVWMRVCIPSTGSDSMWMSLDGGNYKMANSYDYNKSDGGQFVWRRVATYNGLTAGTKHNFRFYPREAWSKIDMILITNRSNAVPSGMGEFEELQLPADQYPAPPILPEKGQHPRLYLTEADIPTLKENMNKPQNAKAKSEFEALLAKETDGRLGESLMDSYTNYDSSTMAIIEAYAYKYALDKDRAYGLKAKNAILNFMSTVTFDQNQQDITRQMGHAIFLGAQVYDWCYDLFEPRERQAVIDKCEEIAMQMEVGYPPDGQGAVCGHGGEAQIMRDLLGFAIATYDERPDIYNFVAGRFFSEFIETRNYWYESGTHHQGDAYGSYRYYWEVVAQEMIYRMTGGDTAGGVKVFNDTQADVPYFWIYSRRPDGQVLRTGDCYNESTRRGSYWTPYTNPLFLSANFYGDAILKGEYEIENPSGAFSYGTAPCSPVIYLLFNDPDLTAQQDKANLPLTRYFGSPNGMMIARTGWDVSAAAPAQSGDVVAMMKIGERWGANHHHLDAGSFQLYYKGILASESGFYESYGSYHDQNYNKASIAHNVLTIYDPNEKFNAYNGKDNKGNAVSFPNGVNDGGQRRPGGEPATMETWMQPAYETGKVLDHAFGPDENSPEYTYIKGDITKAYGGSGSGKVSNVTRAMAFLPLEDDNYPAMMVIMDKVTSTNPSFKKKWLLHTQQEPQIDGTTSVVKRDTDGYNGKLTVQTLLPENASVTKIGGEGKQFWVGNQAGDFENDGNNFALSSVPGPDSAVEAGWGRIEVSPSAARLSDTFLNVLAVSDADNTARPLDSKLLRGENVVGVQTAGKALLFADVDTPSNEKNRITDTASFALAGDAPLDILIMGVKAGTWRVSANGETKTYTATEDGGTLYFAGGAGDYTLAYGGDGYAAQIAAAEASKSGASYTVSATLAGSYADTSVAVAAYDAGGRLLAIRKQACTAQADYRFSFSEAELSGLSEFKLFLWDNRGVALPAAKSRTIPSVEIKQK